MITCEDGEKSQKRGRQQPAPGVPLKAQGKLPEKKRLHRNPYVLVIMLHNVLAPPPCHLLSLIGVFKDVPQKPTQALDVDVSPPVSSGRSEVREGGWNIL